MAQQRDVEFAVFVKTWGDEAAAPTFRALAESAERFGFDSLLAGDRILTPAEIPNEYPFSPTGEPPGEMQPSKNAYELFDVLSFLAGVTEEIHVGSNVCVVPYRHPAYLAKSALTLDNLSEGRFEFGVGVGWMRTEFEVLDANFDERGPWTDEFLRFFEAACEEGELAFDGSHFSMQEAGYHPSPVHEGGPPIWVGGTTGPALRRTAEYGDGLTLIWSPPEDVETFHDRLGRAWRDFDREGAPELAVARPFHLGADGPAPSERLFVGESDGLIEDVEAYVDAGVTRIILDFYVQPVEKRLAQLERFGEQVLPSF